MSRWPDPTDTTERSPRAPRLRDGSAYPSLVFLALRIVISIAGVLFVGDHPIDPSAVGPGAPPARYTEVATSGVHDAIDGMQRWDAAWFRWIAAEGYGSGDDRAAFFPGYPLLIASTSLVTSLDGATASTVGEGLRAASDAVTAWSASFLVVDAALLVVALTGAVFLVPRWA